jgi:hypothetical protein
MELHGTLLFHLNLNYSSIEVARRGEVVRRCYRPLLGLLEDLPWLVVALEASGHTLERIARLDPEWIPRLRELCEQGRVEFVGSGDTQLIGPLVPASVNRWNQALGREAYLRQLGRAPRTALVNEMAWSQGLIDAYLDAGYEALISEWNNPRRHHPEWQEEWRYRAVRTASPTGRSIALLWADALLFQRFQRAVAGELDPDEYVKALLERAGPQARHVFVYANDAEVFDFRPGRYASEPPLDPASEWQRMATILEALRAGGLVFTTPARVLADRRFAPGPQVELSDAANPVPVKKQPKYNVTRWALSGWDDVGVNARCFARARELELAGGSARDWQLLCRSWGSDLRTHLTPRRWRRFRRALPPPGPHRTPAPGRRLEHARVERGERRLKVESDGLCAVLLPRRGLAIESLALRATPCEPLLGTLYLGHFDEIDWAADFYSGHCVLEAPAAGRVTDLEPTEPELEVAADHVALRAAIPSPLGTLPKEVRLFAERLELRYGFSHWRQRPHASLRTGMITLLDGAWGPELFLTCANGGARERFRLHESCDHGRSVSSLVSASAAFGATDGWLALDDGRHGLELYWPQEQAAALPLLTCRRVGARRFVRLAFSLSELDETLRPGAPLYDFRLSIRPHRRRP